MRKRIDVGDVVLIDIQETGTEHITRKMREYDLKQAHVTKATSFIDGRGVRGKYYELSGITSEAGIPYTWLRQELRLLKGRTDQ